MELRETTIDRLRKRLDRDPTEEEIRAERDRKWRFALADMGITRRVLPRREVEGSAFAGAAWQLPRCWPTCPMVGSPRPTP
jgi:hypothetical protein